MSTLLYYLVTYNKNNPYCEYIILLAQKIFSYVIMLGQFIYGQLVMYLRNYLIDVIQDTKLNDQLHKTLHMQLSKLLTDEDIKYKLFDMLKANAAKLSSDQVINDNVHELIQKQLESSDTSARTRAAIAKILKTQTETIVKEEWFEKEVKGQITNVAVMTCDSDIVKTKLRELLEKLTSDLIGSGELNKQLNDLLSKIINDETFMQHAGSGVRRSIRHAFHGMWYGTDSKKPEGEIDMKTETETEELIIEDEHSNTQFNEPCDNIYSENISRKRSGSHTTSLTKETTGSFERFGETARIGNTISINKLGVSVIPRKKLYDSSEKK